MIRVSYTNAKGQLEFRLVPDDAPPTDYHKGIRAGPPDLSSLGLGRKNTKKLNDLLVKRGFGDYTDTKGRRGDLLKTVQSVVGTEESREVFRALLLVYQTDFYPENFEEV